MTGAWLVVSNYGSGTVSVMPIEGDGTLGEPTHSVQHHGRGTKGRRQAGPHAHSATFSPDGRFVLVADLGIDQIVVYAFDTLAGRLGAHTSAHARLGAGPRHLAFHPGGNTLYAANELNNTICALAYEATTGRLHERQCLPTLPQDAPKSYVADIHVAPDGTRVYVSNRGHDTIAVFDIASDEALKPSTVAPCGGRWPRHFTLAPCGRFVLIANQHSGDVAVLPVLEGKTALGNAVTKIAVPGASCVQFVPLVLV